MSENGNRSSARIRNVIARTAAKYVARDGVNDFLAAKKKAAARLGLNPGKNLPSNQEVEEALIEYQGLFQRAIQTELLQEKRTVAMRAMRFLDQFEPRLTGPVLRGTATLHSDITLHVFCEEAEQPGFFLLEHGIPYQVSSKSIRLGQKENVDLPSYRFDAEDNSILLVVFAGKSRKMVPLCAIDGRPEKRIDLKQLMTLLQQPE